jgi:hypothetical protein
VGAAGHAVNNADVHDVVRTLLPRAIYVSGPFPTPFSSAAKFDHVIIICSGAGITAGCAVCTHYRKLNKEIFLIW